MRSFASHIIAFNRSLRFQHPLPNGIRIMNPFMENKAVIELMSSFYKKYYNDTHQRHIILGINPGRFGGGLTGIPFTDPKRLQTACDIPYHGKLTHEPSSVFIYDMINAYGGPKQFYREFYFNSICPLGFTRDTADGKVINYNYYDSAALTMAAESFIIESIKKQISFGVNTDTCFCMGTGKNEKYLRKLNQQHGFFKNIVALEHPRYIMQYKAKQEQFYIDKYIQAFAAVK